MHAVTARESHDSVSHRAGLWRLTLCALGIVFGDIGTSPLYTLKECLLVAGRDRPVEQADLFGILSLMFWALVMVVTVKYVAFVMRADHDGEGASSRCSRSCRNATAAGRGASAACRG